MIEAITQMVIALKEVILAALAIIGYLCERNKREKAELSLAIANTQLVSFQTAVKQVVSASQNINNYIIQGNYQPTPENYRKISREAASIATASISLEEAFDKNLSIGEVLAHCKSKNLLGKTPPLGE